LKEFSLFVTQKNGVKNSLRRALLKINPFLEKIFLKNLFLSCQKEWSLICNVRKTLTMKRNPATKVF
jgi:hypothetical protein